MKAEERKELEEAFKAIAKAISHIGKIEDEINAEAGYTGQLVEMLHEPLFEIQEMLERAGK